VTETAPAASGGQDARSIGDIVGDIATDLSSMVRSELELAKTEAKAEVAKAGKGAGMFGGAAVAGYFALLFLSLFAMYLLGEAMDVQWAALIVFAFWLVVAGVLAVLGRSQLKSVDPTLERTQKTIKETPASLKNTP
jgi:uncharacterized membrane protein YqjE